MRKKAVSFNDVEIMAIENALEIRKSRFFSHNLEYQKELDTLIREVKSKTPQINDEEKITIRRAIEFVYFFEYEDILMKVLGKNKPQEMLLAKPELKHRFEEFNFAFKILNKVKMRSDAKWILIDIPDKRD